MVRGVLHANSTKIFADSFEALLGAVYLHCGMSAAFDTAKSFGLSDGLEREASAAVFRLTATLKVINNRAEAEVGDLHLARERLLAGQKGKNLPNLNFETLEQLDKLIRL